jgi:hypothetical protein
VRWRRDAIGDDAYEVAMAGPTAERIDHIEWRILMVRGHKVLLDSDLAGLYGVAVKRLNEQVKRNAERFPPDFAFELTGEEYEGLRSQTATIDAGRGRHRALMAPPEKPRRRIGFRQD